MRIANAVLFIILVAASAGIAVAQATGPDIIVHGLTDVAAYGSPVGSGITRYCLCSNQASSAIFWSR